MNFKLFGLGIGATLAFHAAGQVGSTDTNFIVGTGVAGSYVHTMATAPDGKVVLGGNFYRVQGESRNHVARLNQDGTIDRDFAPSGGANGEVLGSACQPDLKVLIGGVFTRVNNTNRAHIARLNADGTLDASFDPGTGVNAEVRAIVVQPDGKILIGGPFSRCSGAVCNGVARLNSDGSLDAAFSTGTGCGGERFVDELLLLPDGKLLVAGDFPTFNGIKRASIVRLNTDGSMDSTFDPGVGAKPGDPILGMALQKDGKILLVGSMTSFAGKPLRNLARILADGAVDLEFDPGTGTSGGPINGFLQSVAVEPDGKILIGGWFDHVNGVSRSYLARLLPGGKPDTNWNVRVDGQVRAVKLQEDGKVVIGGDFSRINSAPNARVARLNASGPLPACLRQCRATAGGQFQFELSGDPVRCYALEISEDLVHWRPWRTANCTNGFTQFTDPEASLCAARYYRATLVR
jgi:uncharacterized delta-60 repeat protein